MAMCPQREYLDKKNIDLNDYNYGRRKEKIEQEQQLEEANGGKRRLPPNEEYWVINNPRNNTK